MKQFIRKICFWILDKTKTQKKITPESQVLAEQECVINGHIWRSKLHKNEGPYEVGTKERVYCVRCGQKYHEHIYDTSMQKEFSVKNKVE